MNTLQIFYERNCIEYAKMTYFWFTCACHGDGRSKWPRALRQPLACWNCWYESRRCGGYLSLVIVVWRQVEIPVRGWSLVQMSPTECVVSERDCGASIMRRILGHNKYEIDCSHTGPWFVKMGRHIHVYLRFSVFASYDYIPAAFLCVTCRSLLIGHCCHFFPCPNNKC